MSGFFNKDGSQNLSMIVDKILSSPESMADSLLCNWRWQWFYENKEFLPRKDYDDIHKLDYDVPDCLRKQYEQDIQIWKEKIQAVLQKED